MAQGQMEPPDSQLGHFGERWRTRDTSKALFLEQHMHPSLENFEASQIQDQEQGEGDWPDRPILPSSRWQNFLVLGIGPITFSSNKCDKV